MIFTPLNGQVVVKRKNSESVTRGGIVLPDNAQKESQEGTVLAVFSEYTDADGKTHRPQVDVGDRILFPKYEGEEFDMPPWGKVLLMKGTAIRGIIRDENAEQEEPPGDTYGERIAWLARNAYAEASS